MKQAFVILSLLACSAMSTKSPHHVSYTKSSAKTQRTWELHGQWKVEPFVNIGRRKLPDDLLAQLTDYRLPVPGEVIHAGPEKFCAKSIDCNEVDWTEGRLSNELGGDRLAEELHVPLSSRVFVGDTGNRWVVYTLLVRPDGSFAAIVGLCQNHDRSIGCYNVLEPWRPISPDAKMAPISSRR